MLLAAALALFLVDAILAPPAAAQAVFPEFNDRALAGVKTVDARVIFDTWLEMVDDRNRIRSNIQSAFELGLRRDGVSVDADAPNYLLCRMSFAQSGGLIAYVFTVEYFDFASSGVHPLLWRSGGIVTVGRNKFSPDEAAKSCSDTFANAWLKWNPRQ